MSSLIVDWQGGSATPPYQALVTIPYDYDHMTLTSGTPPNGIYVLDTLAFWYDLKAIEASEEGIVFGDTQSHNDPYTIVGVTYADAIQMIAKVTFSPHTPNEDWTVSLVGSNNNLFDVDAGILVPPGHLTLIPGNSAGLIQTAVSGLTAAESADLKLVRQWLTNAQRIAEGVSANFSMWDDGADPDVDPPLSTQDVTDKDGNAIVLPAGAPANRSEAT